MVDWVVLLTPLLVLTVVALLGFAGCGFSAGVIGDVTLRVRVPTALTVTEVAFSGTRFSGTPIDKVLMNPVPSSTDGGDHVYSFFIYVEEGAEVGTWMTGCRVSVREGTATAEDRDQGDFIYDGDPIEATYQASGSPSGDDFAVTYVGATEVVTT